MRALGVIGSLTRDVVAGAPPRVGGAPYYCARALRVLGVRASIATKCAAEHRRELVPRLSALGVPVAWAPAAATTTFSFSYKGETRRMSVDAVGDPWTRDEVCGWVEESLRRIEWLHAGPVLRGDFPADVMAELARGRRLSLDGQGLVRRRATGPLELDADFDPDCLRHVSILKLADEEARALVGEVGGRALRGLGVPEVVVTYGVNGASVLANGRLERVPVRAVDAPDPTGAGDAFAISYLAGRSTGHPPLAAARRASSIVAYLLGSRRS